jgi:hypothetical protein
MASTQLYSTYSTSHRLSESVQEGKISSISHKHTALYTKSVYDQTYLLQPLSQSNISLQGPDKTAIHHAKLDRAAIAPKSCIR